jgi:hypothetical protein
MLYQGTGQWQRLATVRHVAGREPSIVRNIIDEPVDHRHVDVLARRSVRAKSAARMPATAFMPPPALSAIVLPMTGGPSRAPVIASMP